MYRTFNILLLICFTKCIFGDVCVLQPMVTIKHKQCIPRSFCNDSLNNENDTISEDNGSWLLPDSSSAHFQTVRAVSNSDLIRALAESNVIVSEETLDRLSVNENGSCNASYPYRSFSGNCNNLQHPGWGKSNTPFLRLLQPRYSESTGTIATSVSGSPLPDARYISTSLFPDRDRPSENNTLAAMQWGQLVAHDTGLSPSARIDCCDSYTNYSTNMCFPIEIPENDPFFSHFNRTCLNMVRTYYTFSKYGCDKMREQINNVTHYIDMSNLYGSSSLEVATLRTFVGGQLQTSRTEDGREFPPKSTDPEYDCTGNDIICFRAGDFRVNQNTQLTCLQTVLVREHNRIARNLSSLNPHWSDETVFQTARLINIAQFQHITYNEWIPLYVSEDILAKHHLKPLTEGYTNYRSDINAGTLNNFVAGAFRSLHSTIQGQLLMYNSNRCPVRQLNISDWMNRPGIIVQDSNYDELLLGLTIQHRQKLDRYFTTQMTDLMFHRNLPYGEDLESFDIQRGRDHGIPSYNNIRELCGYNRAENFEDLLSVMDPEMVNILSTLYENVNDIDFFVGGLLENKEPGISVGPTFSCIINEQFVRKKYGDRFWYEVGGESHSLSQEHLREIRKSSFSRLLCDNADNITALQPHGFLHVSESNNVVPCDSLPEVNLSMWSEE